MEAQFSGKYIDIHSHRVVTSAPDVIAVRSVRIGHLSDEGAMSGELIAVGIYPFDAQAASAEWFARLEEAAVAANVFAIGEIGLDYREPYRDSAPVQQSVMERQIEIANRIRKPLIIHQVRALDDTLRLLQKAAVPVIFHGFSGSVESAKRIIDKGYFLSFGHLLMTNEKVRQVLCATPSDRIFLETDDSQISIETIYAKAAETLHISVQELQSQIEQNFRKMIK